MKKVQNLNRSKHQNLNNLFYDIGWQVSKYVDRLQQIVPASMPAADQPDISRCRCRHISLTQLVPVSPVPLESPNVALLPHQAHRKARIVPESMFVARALTFTALSLTLSATPNLSPAKRTDAKNISNCIKLPTCIARPGYCAAKLFCAAYFLGATPSKSPVKQHSSHQTFS